MANLLSKLEYYLEDMSWLWAPINQTGLGLSTSLDPTLTSSVGVGVNSRFSVKELTGFKSWKWTERQTWQGCFISSNEPGIRKSQLNSKKYKRILLTSKKAV